MGGAPLERLPVLARMISSFPPGRLARHLASHITQRLKRGLHPFGYAMNGPTIPYRRSVCATGTHSGAAPAESAARAAPSLSASTAALTGLRTTGTSRKRSGIITESP